VKKIPPKEKIREAIKKAVKERKVVRSSVELAAIVTRYLRKENKFYTVSSTRVKKIALSIPEIEVRAKTKRSSKVKKIEKCPICGSPLKPLVITNLQGKKVIVGFECVNCGYKSTLESFLPKEYIFVWKG